MRQPVSRWPRRLRNQAINGPLHFNVRWLHETEFPKGLTFKLRFKSGRLHASADAIRQLLEERGILNVPNASPKTTMEQWQRTDSLDVFDDQADGNRCLHLSFVGAHKCQDLASISASSEQLR